jgi:hypothetical protein
MRVELLQHHGCPHADAARELIEECLGALAISAPILVRVGDYPSPTVLVDGIDVMHPARAVSPGSACRLDVPARDRLLDILTAHLAAQACRERSTHGDGSASRSTPGASAPAVGSSRSPTAA